MPLTLSLLIINSLEVNIMSNKLTQEEFEQRVFNLVGNKYSVIGEYQGKEFSILMHCNIHNCDFKTRARYFMYENHYHANGGCPKCYEDFRHQKSIKIICDYCHKEYYTTSSKLNKSKSGLHFCCKEHKLLAQRLESGEQFKKMRPLHYGTADSEYTYRAKAFRNYSHCCAVCDWQDDEDILQVHHIDENRDNNSLENLIILCPTCHAKLTSRKYELINRKKIVLRE